MNYKIDFTCEGSTMLDAKNEEQARAMFMDKINRLNTSEEDPIPTIQITSVKPVELHQYEFFYEYTAFCRKVVEAETEEEARKLFPKVAWEGEDEYDCTKKRITDVRVLPADMEE